MIGLKETLNELVIANRILAKEDVVDAYGHVSVRNPENPERFFMAHMLAPPEIVERGDLIEFNLEGQAVTGRRTPSIERFIHGAIYEARPDVHAVVHAHAEDRQFPTAGNLRLNDSFTPASTRRARTSMLWFMRMPRTACRLASARFHCGP